MDWLSEPSAWMGLLTLTILEIVLGIDNIVFISILAGKLPEHQRKKAWQVGLGLALVMRILLLLGIAWLIGLKENVFTLPIPEGFFGYHDGKPNFDPGMSWKDLILLGGGIWLLFQAVKEIHHKLEGPEHEEVAPTAGEQGKKMFTGVIINILAIDLVFSLDSVITAVGMIDEVSIMIIAVVIAIGFMMLFAQPVSAFVNKHPSVKMLALAFLVMIGVVLFAESFGVHVPKGYIYTAMAFSVIVEMLNLRYRSKKAVKLRGPGEGIVEKP